MRMIRFGVSALKEGRWYEHLVRFLLGGLATVIAGLVAKFAGPSWGGLFLAFPAVFCASSTLIEKHESKRKRDKHLLGAGRGKEAAALDAFGAAMGSIGMAAFALTVWSLSTMAPTLVLGLAMVAWSIAAVLAWYLGKITHVGDLWRWTPPFKERAR